MGQTWCSNRKIGEVLFLCPLIRAPCNLEVWKRDVAWNILQGFPLFPKTEVGRNVTEGSLRLILLCGSVPSVLKSVKSCFKLLFLEHFSSSDANMQQTPSTWTITSLSQNCLFQHLWESVIILNYFLPHLRIKLTVFICRSIEFGDGAAWSCFVRKNQTERLHH